MRLLRHIVWLLLICGCVSFPAPSNPCQQQEDRYISWYAVGVVSGSLAGATGTSGVLTSTLADEPYADIALAASSMVFGALATLGTVLSGIYAENYAECVDANAVDSPP